MGGNLLSGTETSNVLNQYYATSTVGEKLAKNLSQVGINLHNNLH